MGYQEFVRPTFRAPHSSIPLFGPLWAPPWGPVLQPMGLGRATETQEPVMEVGVGAAWRRKDPMSARTLLSVPPLSCTPEVFI